MAAGEQDIARLCASLKTVALRNTLTEAGKATVRDVTPNVLLSWGVLAEKAGTLVPTNAYALLTGQMREQPVIQCAVFKGVDRAYFVDRREFGGSIQEQVEAAYQYVLEKMNRGMKIKDVYRQDVFELPPDSVRELIANSVAHRSYLEPGNIQVALYDDRLEITSPGMLLNGVSIDKMKAGYSKIRNRAIANAFSYMKIIEKWGSGIPRVLRECEEYGLPKPQFIDSEGDFRVNMVRQQGSSLGSTQTTQTPTQTTQTKLASLSLQDKAVLAVLFAHPEYTQKQLAETLEWPIDRVKYYLNKMKKQKTIKRVGSSHNGHWEILIEESTWRN